MYFGSGFLGPGGQFVFEAVESDVGKGRRDDAALRCALVGAVEGIFVQLPCFEPHAEDVLVHDRDVVHQPLVVNAVETGFDVAFEYPCRRIADGQHLMGTSDGVGA